jgi:hypothetical protein
MNNLKGEARQKIVNIEMQLVRAIDRAIKTGQVTEFRFGGAGHTNWNCQLQQLKNRQRALSEG